MTQKVTLQFPKRFLWGASTAAHQIEGGMHNQWTVWELENAKSLAAQAEYHYGDLDSWEKIRPEATNPDNYISGKASQHQQRYKQDFELLSSMHLNAYRFSIEWSRLEPSEGSWNSEAVQYYRDYIKRLRSMRIEPMMTLFHFTVPVWFAEKGGFEKRSNLKYFYRYVEKVMSELGKDITYVITINEPDVYAGQSYGVGLWPPNVRSKWRMYKVIRNLIRAHNTSSKLIHRLHKRYRVSIAKNSNYFYPGDDAWLTRVSAGIMQYFQDDYILRRVMERCDFIGVNYYFSNRVYGYRIHNPHEHMSDLGWDMQPENLEYVLERLWRKYKKPLIVTENGLADTTDAKRKWWLMKTMVALSNALKEGVDVWGYFHWSLLDNFEWAQGKWPRFGLASVDYTTGKRTLRVSAKWWSQVLLRMRKGEQ